MVKISRQAIEDGLWAYSNQGASFDRDVLKPALQSEERMKAYNKLMEYVTHLSELPENQKNQLLGEMKNFKQKYL